MADIPTSAFYGGNGPKQTTSKENISFHCKLRRIDEESKMLKERPMVKVKRRSFFAPHHVWEEFSTQLQAQEYAAKCKEKINKDVHIFARELSTDGKRLYIVTSYEEFWERYKKIPRNKRNFYEMIQDGEECRLYFDLEFYKDVNRDLDGVEVLEIFIETVCFYLQEIFGMPCDRGCIIDLDSSTEAKFSRHLIFHLPKAVFANNVVCGNFVKYIYEMTRIKVLQVGNVKFGNMKTLTVSEKEILPPDSLDIGKLFVRNRDGEMAFFCDLGVYTRNRNFRLYGSTKISKNATLVVSEQNGFHGDEKKRRKFRKNPDVLDKLFFLDTLVCFDDKHESGMKVLTFGDVNAMPSRGFCNGMQKRTEEGYRTSPFPKLDEFMKTQINKGGVQGVLRRWIHFQSSNLMLYDIDRNHWCDNIKRPHKSNHIYFIVDMGVKAFYQKCHDPDCHDFKSEERLLPDEVNPVLNDSEYVIDEFEDSSRLLCEAVEIAECEDSFMIEEQNNPKNTRMGNCQQKVQNVENDRYRTSQDFSDFSSDFDNLTEHIFAQDSQPLSITGNLESDRNDFEDDIKSWDFILSAEEGLAKSSRNDFEVDIKSWDFNLSPEEGLAKSGPQDSANQMKLHDDAGQRTEKELDLFDAEDDFVWEDLDIENMSSVGNTESEFAVTTSNIRESLCNYETTTDLPKYTATTELSSCNWNETMELSAESFEKAPRLQLAESSRQNYFKSDKFATEFFSEVVNDISSGRKTLKRQGNLRSMFTTDGDQGERASKFHADEECFNTSLVDGKRISAIAERDMYASCTEEEISESLEEQLNKEFSMETEQEKSHEVSKIETYHLTQFREWREEKLENFTCFQEMSEAGYDIEAVRHDSRIRQNYDSCKHDIVDNSNLNSNANSSRTVFYVEGSGGETSYNRTNRTRLLNDQTHRTSSGQNVQSTPLLAKQNHADYSVVRCELSDICLDDELDEELLKLI